MTDTNNDTGIDAAAFGLPTGVNGDSNPGFMYGNDLEVDQNDPIYQATVEAMKAQGIEVPLPGEEERPPELIPASEEDAGGEPPATPEDSTDQSANNQDPATNDDGSIGTADTNDTPPIEPGTEITPPAANDGTPPADPDTDSDDEAPVLAFQVDGADVSLNAEQGEYLLRVNTWLENLPPETKQQWAGIEAGTHVAITAEEHQALIAAAQKQQQAPAAQPQAPDLDDLDDDTAAYIRSLEARIPATQQGGQQDIGPGQSGQPQSQPDTMEMQAAFRRQEEQRTQMLSELAATNEKYKSQYNLSDQQLERLSEVTTQLAVIPAISRSKTQYSPTGQVIHQPAFGDVVAEAYEVAMNHDPALRQIRDDMIYNQRVARDAERNQAVNAKRAKAGTLASSPSAAVPANQGTPKISPDNRMDLQATSNQIAAHLAQLAEQS